MANYLVAVSGGVDSVVLLDMLTKTKHTLIVAHVDHGIRGEESAADARFVAALAKKYQLPCVTTSLQLGAKASEEQARNGRYRFLFNEAKKHSASVVTAHHADDAVETIALNLTRGTGWRGLAVLGRQDIVRPLLGLTKEQLYNYALTYRLEWVEDGTNREDRYLRNRLRKVAGAKKIDRPALLALRAAQLQLRREIDQEVERVVERSDNSRYFLNMLDESVAAELLGAAIKACVGVRPIRSQLERALHAIKTAAPGAKYQVGDGVELVLSAQKYTITALD